MYLHVLLYVYVLSSIIIYATTLFFFSLYTFSLNYFYYFVVVGRLRMIFFISLFFGSFFYFNESNLSPSLSKFKWFIDCFFSHDIPRVQSSMITLAILHWLQKDPSRVFLSMYVRAGVHVRVSIDSSMHVLRIQCLYINARIHPKKEYYYVDIIATLVCTCTYIRKRLLIHKRRRLRRRPLRLRYCQKLWSMKSFMCWRLKKKICLWQRVLSLFLFLSHARILQFGIQKSSIPPMFTTAHTQIEWMEVADVKPTIPLHFIFDPTGIKQNQYNEWMNVQKYQIYVHGTAHGTAERHVHRIWVELPILSRTWKFLRNIKESERELISRVWCVEVCALKRKNAPLIERGVDDDDE